MNKEVIAGLTYEERMKIAEAEVSLCKVYEALDEVHEAVYYRWADALAETKKADNEQYDTLRTVLDIKKRIMECFRMFGKIMEEPEQIRMEGKP